MDQIIGYALSAVILVAIIVGSFAYTRRRDESRRSRELRDVNRRLHWALITGYMGKADPTKLTRPQAQKILDDNWGCPDAAKLRRKIEIYRHGEINDAFDVGRILWLAELGCAAGMITEPDVFGLSEEGVTRLRQKYRSWQEYADALRSGRERWYAEIAKEGAMPAAQRTFTEEALRTAEKIWAKIPW
jgi:hypothetical protein